VLRYLEGGSLVKEKTWTQTRFSIKSEKGGGDVERKKKPDGLKVVSVTTFIQTRDRGLVNGREGEKGTRREGGNRGFQGWLVGG